MLGSTLKTPAPLDTSGLDGLLAGLPSVTPGAVFSPGGLGAQLPMDATPSRVGELFSKQQAAVARAEEELAAERQAGAQLRSRLAATLAQESTITSLQTTLSTTKISLSRLKRNLLKEKLNGNNYNKQYKG